jgi:hypothetical protein
MSSLELQPTKDTEVENIFCCSSVVGQSLAAAKLAVVRSFNVDPFVLTYKKKYQLRLVFANC